MHAVISMLIEAVAVGLLFACLFVWVAIYWTA